MRVPANVISTRAAERRRPERQPERRVRVERRASGVLGSLPVDVGQPRVARRLSRRHRSGTARCRVATPGAHRRGPSNPSSVTLATSELPGAAIPDDDRHVHASGPARSSPSLAVASIRTPCASTIASCSCCSFRRRRELDFVLARRRVNPIDPSLGRRDRAPPVSAADEIGHRRRRAARLERARGRVDARRDRRRVPPTSGCGGRSPA